ncbi:MAG TPA: hypothetical protein VG501_08515 [Rhizomicrobium sp.]|nr:hypothetical protein [Rhizomicrobium sp.]
MARDSSSTKPLAKENRRENLKVPPRVLEVAKWPEHDMEEEWDLEKWNPKDSAGPEEPAASRFFAGEPGPDDEWQDQDEENLVPDSLQWALVRGESLSHPVADHEQAGRHRAAKVAAGIVAGLLLIGGGIYAYQSTPVATPRNPAMKTPPVVMPPAAAVISPAAGGAPAGGPAAGARESQKTVLPPTLVSPSVPPLGIAPPAFAPSQEKAAPPRRRTAQNPHRRMRGYSYEDDDPINAPMTLTPETAPPPQRPLPAVPR